MTYLEAISRVDHGYFMLGKINEKLSTKKQPIEQMIDNACGHDDTEELRELTIDVMKDIIKCKKVLEVDCSKDIAMLNELKKMKQ